MDCSALEDIERKVAMKYSDMILKRGKKARFKFLDRRDPTNKEVIDMLVFSNSLINPRERRLNAEVIIPEAYDYVYNDDSTYRSVGVYEPCHDKINLRERESTILVLSAGFHEIAERLFTKPPMRRMSRYLNMPLSEDGDLGDDEALYDTVHPLCDIIHILFTEKFENDNRLGGRLRAVTRYVFGKAQDKPKSEFVKSYITPAPGWDFNKILNQYLQPVSQMNHKPEDSIVSSGIYMFKQHPAVKGAVQSA